MEAHEALNVYGDRITEAGLSPALDAADAAARDLADPIGEMARVLPRIPVVTARARTVLAQADPFRVSLTHISNIAARLAQVSAHLAAAATGEDRSPQIDSEIDALLDELALVIAASWTEGGEPGHEAVSAMREVLLRGEATLSEGLQQLEARLVELAAREQLQTARIAELQALLDQTTAELTAYRAAGTEAVDALRTANSSALTEFRSAFDNVTTESVAAGKLQVKELLDNTAEAQAAQLAAAKSDLDAHADSAAAILVTLKEREAEVMKLANALGTGAQSAGWGAYADQQRKAANRMLGGAVAGFAAAAGVAVWIAVSAGDSTDEVSWHRIITKLAVTTALGLVGGYLATQSSEHRHQERLARRRHLDLLALPLFIAQLDDTKQQEIVAKLAEEGFLTPDPKPVPKNPRKGIPTSQIPEIIAATKAALK